MELGAQKRESDKPLYNLFGTAKEHLLLPTQIGIHIKASFYQNRDLNVEHLWLLKAEVIKAPLDVQ